MTSISIAEWTNLLHIEIPDLNGPTNNFLYNLRFHSSNISFENMNFDTLYTIEEPVPEPIKINQITIYNDPNNRFNQLMNAW